MNVSYLSMPHRQHIDSQALTGQLRYQPCLTLPEPHNSDHRDRCRPRAAWVGHLSILGLQDHLAFRARKKELLYMRISMSKTLFVALALLVLAATPVMAQTVSGSISGSVVDASHAAIPGATVTANEQEKNVSLTTKADAAGRFVFAQVAPGTYKIMVRSQGFKEFIQDNVTVNANDRIALGEVTMQVGAVTEHVEVSAAIVTMQTESA